MDQVLGERAPVESRREWLNSGLEGGLVLVNSAGEIMWMDEGTRARVNGELQHLALPLPKTDQAIECFIAPATVTVNGERVRIGVVQEQAHEKPTADVLAAIETAVTDATSWFSRAVIEKLKALGQPTQSNDQPTARASGVDVLSDREREVLGLICEGKNHVQMGEILGLSENTVRNHIASLYRKIGVNRRTAAIIWARERGITDRGAFDLRRRRSPAPQTGKSALH
jgi:DNA-binding CsgD family transcriptional regulator